MNRKQIKTREKKEKWGIVTKIEWVRGKKKKREGWKKRECCVALKEWTIYRSQNCLFSVIKSSLFLFDFFYFCKWECSSTFGDFPWVGSLCTTPRISFSRFFPFLSFLSFLQKSLVASKGQVRCPKSKGSGQPLKKRGKTNTSTFLLPLCPFLNPALFQG